MPVVCQFDGFSLQSNRKMIEAAVCCNLYDADVSDRTTIERNARTDGVYERTAGPSRRGSYPVRDMHPIKNQLLMSKPEIAFTSQSTLGLTIKSREIAI